MLWVQYCMQKKSVRAIWLIACISDGEQMNDQLDVVCLLLDKLS